VLSQITQYVNEFRAAQNVATSQADLVVHGMGGVIARSAVQLPNYATPESDYISETSSSGKGSWSVAASRASFLSLLARSGISVEGLGATKTSSILLLKILAKSNAKGRLGSYLPVSIELTV